MSAPICCPEALIALRYLIHPKASEAVQACRYCGPGILTGLPGNACENCMNTGFEGPWSECPDCEGAGEIYWPGSRDPASAAERCFRCDGTGMITGEAA